MAFEGFKYQYKMLRELVNLPPMPKIEAQDVKVASLGLVAMGIGLVQVLKQKEALGEMTITGGALVIAGVAANIDRRRTRVDADFTQSIDDYEVMEQLFNEATPVELLDRQASWESQKLTKPDEE